MRSIAAVLLLLLGSAPAALAQEQEIDEADLPREVADRLLGIIQDPRTVRLQGESRIPADSVVAGNVAARGGPVFVAGRIKGALVVVHGDVELEPTAVVEGDITVIGGEVRGADSATVAGTLTAYGDEFRYIQRGERSRYVHRSRRRAPRLEGDVGLGSSSFVIRAGSSYNRIEGLPIQIGPVIETRGANPMRLSAQAVVRTEDLGFDTDRVGYTARLEQFLGGRRSFRVGGGVHSVIQPIEAWGLSDTENSLSTFLFHTDHRDYFERTGWSAFARVTPSGAPVDLTVEYRDERHDLVPAGDPWTITGEDPWRLQPLAATGTLRSVSGRVRFDTRDDRDDPIAGLLIDASVQRAVGGSLEMPRVMFLPPAGGPRELPRPEFDDRFSSGFLDVRLYNPVGRGARLNLRGVVGGSLTDAVLPPQFQHALGGEGSLPGYDRLSLDCGARIDVLSLQRQDEVRAFHPYYGCDRMALFQAEYRGSLDFDFDWAQDEEGADEVDQDWSWDSGDPSWIVFFDAGRGWSNGEWGGTPRRGTDTRYDAGLGLLLGDVGLYWAVPLSGEDRSVNFFLRLKKRF